MEFTANIRDGALADECWTSSIKLGVGLRFKTAVFSCAGDALWGIFACTWLRMCPVVYVTEVWAQVARQCWDAAGVRWQTTILPENIPAIVLIGACFLATELQAVMFISQSMWLNRMLLQRLDISTRNHAVGSNILMFLMLLLHYRRLIYMSERWPVLCYM